MIACFSDEQWSSLRQALGSPDWAGARFDSLAGRKEHEDELEEKLGEWTIEQLPEDVMTTLQAAGVPAAVVQNARDLLESDEHLRERDYYVYLDHPEAGRTAYDGPGFRLSKTPADYRTAACMLGEHNEQVCKEILGLSDEEIADLMVEQVLY